MYVCVETLRTLDLLNSYSDKLEREREKKKKLHLKAVTTFNLCDFSLYTRSE